MIKMHKKNIMTQECARKEGMLKTEEVTNRSAKAWLANM